MRHKINNTTLLIVFAALLVLTIVLFSGGNDHRERSFDKQLLSFETEDVSAIKLYPKSMNGAYFTIENEDGQWTIVSDDKRYSANNSSVDAMVSALQTLDIKSLVANKKDRWEKYEVNDSLASRVQLLSGSKVLADVYIGKFQFSQPQNMSTYVRLADEKETYRANGFLSSTFNRNVNDLRDKTLVDDRLANWTKMMFDYPADSSFVLEKQGEKWLLDGGMADSASVVSYINKVKQLNGRTIADVAENDVNKKYRLTIERKNLDAVVLTAGMAEDKRVVTSSENNDVWISDSDVLDKIFVSKNEFSVIKQ
ncbi:MAG: DUF4340 domain-containing protein [Prolixibacteraceae bacterium]|nr:DUF4340 domain-containing protein [Prolixibacteraceae bacterium]MBN2648478.1 DUF4340 domain-containing protein [Prolixibacteraceae bacterium]